jgi:hypothetical protein
MSLDEPGNAMPAPVPALEAQLPGTWTMHALKRTPEPAMARITVSFVAPASWACAEAAAKAVTPAFGGWEGGPRFGLRRRRPLNTSLLPWLLGGYARHGVGRLP